MEREKAPSMALTSNGMSQEEYYKRQCERYNSIEGRLDLKDGYSCSKCKNRGYISGAKKENGVWYEYTRECECMSVRRQLANLKRSGLTGVEKNTFANFNATENWQVVIKQAVMAYSNNPFNKWLYLGGQSGCGKSHLCIACAAAIVKLHSKSVYYMVWRDEAARLKAIINDDPEEYKKRTDELKNVGVLYIDDLFKTGKGSPTVGDVNLAFEILNHRYMNGLSTIISSELTLDELIDVDEAVAGRIAERAGTEYLLSVGKDRKKNYRLRGITL